MRRSAKVLLSAGGVLVLTAAGLAWLVATPSGQQMLLRTALPLVPGLKAGSIEGGFFDLTITDLSYEMPGLTAGADRKRADAKGFDGERLSDPGGGGAEVG